MNNLEKQLNNEMLYEKDFKSALSVIKVQFDKFIHAEMLKARHEQEIQKRLKRLNEGKLQIQECMVQKAKASDASLGEKYCSRIVSDKGNDQEPMVEVTYTAEFNVFSITQHSEQPECIINTCVVEKVDRNVILDSPDMCDNEI
ncbi:hypothetical protein Tco_1475739 [Tanacetum coccineum]